MHQAGPWTLRWGPGSLGVTEMGENDMNVAGLTGSRISSKDGEIGVESRREEQTLAVWGAALLSLRGGCLFEQEPTRLSLSPLERILCRQELHGY